MFSGACQLRRPPGQPQWEWPPCGHYTALDADHLVPIPLAPTGMPPIQRKISIRRPVSSRSLRFFGTDWRRPWYTKSYHKGILPLPCPHFLRFSNERYQSSQHLGVFAFQGETQIGRWQVSSVGGGEIQIQGQPDPQSHLVYPLHTFAEIAAYCQQKKPPPLGICPKSRGGGNLGVSRHGLEYDEIQYSGRLTANWSTAGGPWRPTESKTPFGSVPILTKARRQKKTGWYAPYTFAVSGTKCGQRRHCHRPHLRRQRRFARRAVL